MDMKVILLGLALLIVAVTLGLVYMGWTSGTVMGIESFQNPSPPSVPTFTMFYADWCGHCKKAKPAFTQFMGDGTLEISSVKCKVEMVNADSGDPRLKALNVQGYPSFILQLPNGTTAEYKGKRETDGYLDFLNSSLK
jgi:thiol-disulfide isomerase/thioredoxin